jgi:plasmid stabilization system protein ParE
MKQLDISPIARLDILDLAELSSHLFGHIQTDRYLEDLDAVMLNACKFPDFGKPIKIAGVTFRRLKSGSHYAYYIYDETLLRVVRVIHTNRDQAKAFKR